jgi:uncharacterized protein YbjT (DUF2867 family)
VLTGPEALTYDDIAKELSDALGRKITHIGLKPMEMKSGMLASGVPEWLADLQVDLERHYREGNGSVISDDIRKVTGRDPRRFEQFARDYASALKA